jgi:hypothetical protein
MSYITINQLLNKNMITIDPLLCDALYQKPPYPTTVSKKQLLKVLFKHSIDTYYIIVNGDNQWKNFTSGVIAKNGVGPKKNITIYTDRNKQRGRYRN